MIFKLRHSKQLLGNYLGEKKASTVKRCVCVCVHVSVRVCFIFRDDSHALNSTHTQVEWEILRII